MPEPGDLHPLYEAARDGDVKELERLIGQGGDVNWAADPDEDTPLHYAARNDQVEAVKLLLRLGADPERRDRYGYTPFDGAINAGAPRAAPLLFDLQTRQDKDRFGTVLSAAVVLGLTDLVLEELKKGADPNQKDHKGTAPIHLALSSWEGTARLARLILSRRKGLAPAPWKPGENRMPILAALLSHGADPNARDGANWTPIRLAAHGGDMESLKYLLGHGVSLESEIDRWVLVDSTAHGGHAEVLRFLIAKGLSAQGSPEADESPLHTAAWMGHAACVDVLLAAGADRARKNGRGETALDRAKVRLERIQEDIKLYSSYHIRWEAKRKESEEQAAAFRGIISALSNPRPGP